MPRTDFLLLEACGNGQQLCSTRQADDDDDDDVCGGKSCNIKIKCNLLLYLYLYVVAHRLLGMDSVPTSNSDSSSMFMFDPDSSVRSMQMFEPGSYTDSLRMSASALQTLFG